MFTVYVKNSSLWFLRVILIVCIPAFVFLLLDAEELLDRIGDLFGCVAVAVGVFGFCHLVICVLIGQKAMKAIVNALFLGSGEL